ncbi:MAG: hypothetical protein JXB07_14035 [Anaerolineae bacterium]|nr:hypothetical protein [Anaerolineae bacterium]
MRRASCIIIPMRRDAVQPITPTPVAIHRSGADCAGLDRRLSGQNLM